jgi:hypothetical protein
MLKLFKKYLLLIKNRKFGMNYEFNIPSNPKHNDIYLVEFPKSGITFLTFLIGNIELKRNKIDDTKMSFFNTHRFIPDVHLLNKIPLDRKLKNAFMKSHSSYQSEYGHVVYLIRNPLDVMVSFYNYMIGFGNSDSFEDFIKSPVYGIDAWISHVKSWTNQLDTNQKIILIRYEDLVSSTKETIISIYDQLGVSLQDEDIKFAIDNSSLSSMKKSEEIYTNHSPIYSKSFVGSSGKLSKDQLVNNDIKNYINKKIKKSNLKFY